jgi:hypothetical protein
LALIWTFPSQSASASISDFPIFQGADMHLDVDFDLDFCIAHCMGMDLDIVIGHGFAICAIASTYPSCL